MGSNIDILAKALDQSDINNPSIRIVNPNGTILGDIGLMFISVLLKATAGNIIVADASANWTSQAQSVLSPQRALLASIPGVLTTASTAFLDCCSFGATSRTISKVSIQVGTAPTGASLIVTVLKNGSSIGTITITAGNTTAYSTSLSPNTFADGDRLTFNVTQIGSSVAGSNLGARVEFI